MSTRIYALIMSKIFKWIPKIIRKVATASIWIRSPSCNNRVSNARRSELVRNKKPCKTQLLYMCAVYLMCLASRVNHFFCVLQDVHINVYVVQLLGLDVCANILVGDNMHRGISGGQRKRVTTGMWYLRFHGHVSAIVKYLSSLNSSKHCGTLSCENWISSWH